VTELSDEKCLWHFALLCQPAHKLESGYQRRNEIKKRKGKVVPVL